MLRASKFSPKIFLQIIVCNSCLEEIKVIVSNNIPVIYYELFMSFINLCSVKLIDRSTLVPAVSMWLGLHQATMGISLLLLFDFQECVICYISSCQYAPCKSVLFFFLPNFWSISWIPTHSPAEILFLVNCGLGLCAWCCIPKFQNIK